MLSPLGWHIGAVTNARRRGLHVEKQLLALFSSDVPTLGRRLWHYSPCLNVWRMVFLSQLQTGTGKNLISSAAKMDVREKKEKKKKKSMEKVRGRESAGRENSNKVKKVLAHQSSRPAVWGDISLVHFVNREIVCRGSGRVRVTRTDRDTQR